MAYKLTRERKLVHHSHYVYQVWLTLPSGEKEYGVWIRVFPHETFKKAIEIHGGKGTIVDVANSGMSIQKVAMKDEDGRIKYV